MPKSKEYLSSDGSSSSEEEKKSSKRKHKESKAEKAEPSKKTKKPAPKEEEEDAEPSWDLGNNRFVKIREFKGKVLLDIREMYLDKDGDMKPGRKGISLNMTQWRKFMDNIEEIDKKAKSMC